MSWDGRIIEHRGGGLLPKHAFTDKPMEEDYDPLEITEGILKWYDAGADGVFRFNVEVCVSVRNLAYPEIMREQVKAGRVFYINPKEKIKWLE